MGRAGGLEQWGRDWWTITVEEGLVDYNSGGGAGGLLLWRGLVDSNSGGGTGGL